MKKVLLIIFMLTGIIYADDSSVIGLYSGWAYYPYSYYPYSPRYYAPWYYHTYRQGPIYPYSYPEYSGWYDYDYPYCYPYGGIYLQSSSMLINLNPGNIIDLSKIDSYPQLPGSAPLSLRSKNDVSIQDERLRLFLSGDSGTNTPPRLKAAE